MECRARKDHNDGRYYGAKEKMSGEREKRWREEMIQIAPNGERECEISRDRLYATHISRVFSFASYMRIERGHPSTSRTMPSFHFHGWLPSSTRAHVLRFYFRRPATQLVHFANNYYVCIVQVESFLSPKALRTERGIVRGRYPSFVICQQ